MKQDELSTRRQALGVLAGAPVALAAAAGGAAAQPQRPAQAGSAAPPGGGGRGGGRRAPESLFQKPATQPATPSLALVSRHLQWAGVEEGIEAARAAGFPGIAWTVRPGAHIDAAVVEKELPRVFELTRRAGMATPMIITSIGDVTAPRIEAILGTMQSLGIQRYRAAAPRYVYDADFAAQYDAFRVKLDGLAKLNERFGTTAMFHTHSYANTIGGSGWDLWMAMKDLDPRYIGINYDIGHTTVKGGAGWMESSRAAHRHIKAVSVKDFHWVRRADAGVDEWPWQPEFIPPGQGMVNFNDFFRTMYGLGYDGPVETYFEYKVPAPGAGGQMDMLGTNFGQWTLEIPKPQFIAYMKRDVDFYKAHLRRAGYTL